MEASFILWPLYPKKKVPGTHSIDILNVAVKREMSTPGLGFYN
jgi:hypothetical protein